MSDGQVVQLERRAGQRFDFHLPVSVRPAGSEHEGCGFTQNLSARGVFFYTDCPLQEGSGVELALVMPSEITLAENMRVRCRGRVMRVTPMSTKAAVAVYLESYEFLPQTESFPEASASFARISALHEHTHEEKTPARPESRRAAAR
jgi:PilZ domain